MSFARRRCLPLLLLAVGAGAAAAEPVPAGCRTDQQRLCGADATPACLIEHLTELSARCRGRLRAIARDNPCPQRLMHALCGPEPADACRGALGLRLPQACKDLRAPDTDADDDD